MKLANYVERFTYEALFVEDLNSDMALASFTNGLRHKHLSKTVHLGTASY